MKQFSRNQDKFFDENRPSTVPAEEKTFLPPHTPSPRILEAQANLRSMKVADLRDKQVLNYWKSKEAEFAVPIEHPSTLSRPISPRVALNDPPRGTTKMDPPPVYRPETFKPVIKTPIVTKRAPPKEQKKPLTVKTTPEVVNFGNIRQNMSASTKLTLTNLGATPLHFSVSQPSNEFVKVLALPGVVYPGLKMTLKISLMPAPKQKISTSFQLKTNLYDITVPVFVNITS
ncbi:hypothetical protein GPJ56_007624 [Histomonas meleagridis]|uniref:uncharacterized protein n=1 Tax=Histomonas meleagridis TaxID=135588 RepID=UPI00355A403C|nr:hypothetical protein GPJ56_007624 [Histomonas meleagridis]KAH0803586.1 hypothetical protein GO595_003637 [Histomonas meleagridis]